MHVKPSKDMCQWVVHGPLRTRGGGGQVESDRPAGHGQFSGVLQ